MSGLMNVTMLILLILVMLALFVFYPSFKFHYEIACFDGNIWINGTGVFRILLSLIALLVPDTF